MSDDLRAAAERCREIIAPGVWVDLQNAPVTFVADVIELARAYLAEQPVIWTDEECFRLNAQQHRADLHPYTCGNDSRHRPLIATRRGWRCADCDYRQTWAGVPLGEPAKE